MGLRAFIAALVGAGVGFVQCIVIAVIEGHRDGRPLPVGDVSYTFFALGWFIELMALMVISMYRIAPWIARGLGDDWEATRILKDKRRHVSILEWACVIALLLRALARLVDAGHFTWSILAGLAFGLIPLAIPRPFQRTGSPQRSTNSPPAR